MATSNQAHQILKLIQASGTRGVENWRLVDISLKYSSRITELRQAGYNIVGERQIVNGRHTGTWRYYLRPQPAVSYPPVEGDDLSPVALLDIPLAQQTTLL